MAGMIGVIKYPANMKATQETKKAAITMTATIFNIGISRFLKSVRKATTMVPMPESNLWITDLVDSVCRFTLFFLN